MSEILPADVETMTKKPDFEVAAKGVENNRQFNFLKQRGYDFFPNYLSVRHYPKRISPDWPAAINFTLKSESPCIPRLIVPYTPHGSIALQP
ncbi:MAG: hypothetical protein AB2792_14470 [Candidatus Thiodiazotropha sp.]